VFFTKKSVVQWLHVTPAESFPYSFFLAWLFPIVSKDWFLKILLLSINIEIITFAAIDLLDYCYSMSMEMDQGRQGELNSMTGTMSSAYDEDEAPLPVPVHASRSGGA